MCKYVLLNQSLYPKQDCQVFGCETVPTALLFMSTVFVQEPPTVHETSSHDQFAQKLVAFTLKCPG